MRVGVWPLFPLAPFSFANTPSRSTHHPFPPFGLPRLPDEIPHQEKTAAHTCQGQRKRRRLMVQLPVCIHNMPVFVSPHLDDLPRSSTRIGCGIDQNTLGWNIILVTWNSQIQKGSRTPPTGFPFLPLSYNPCFRFRTILSDFSSCRHHQCGQKPRHHPKCQAPEQDSQTGISGAR